MDKLMESLINAKKVMNKLDSNNYERGHVDQNIINQDPEELMENIQSGKQKVGYQDKVKESRLPEAIKQLMIENPIPEPQLDFTSSLDLRFDEAAKIMEKQGLKRSPKQAAPASKPTAGGMPISLNETVLKELKPLLEHIIETTIEKVLADKLAKMETKTQKINENLHIKVGDSVFTGKITGVKSSPTKKK